MYTATWRNLSLTVLPIHTHITHKCMHTHTTIHTSHSCTQETWAKRLSYIQVVVELVADASHRKETHSHSYSDPISHLFQTAVDVCVLGTNIFCAISSPTPGPIPSPLALASLPGHLPRPHSESSYAQASFLGLQFWLLAVIGGNDPAVFHTYWQAECQVS